MHGERVGRIRREEEKRKQEGWEEKKETNVFFRLWRIANTSREG
jgi:hypothetical protein